MLISRIDLNNQTPVVALSVISKIAFSHRMNGASLFLAAYVMRSKQVIVDVLKSVQQIPKCIYRKQVLAIEKSRDEVVKCVSIAPNASINRRAPRGESQRSNLTISLTHSFSPRHSSVQCSSELLNSPRAHSLV